MSCMDKTIGQSIQSFKERQEFKERKLEEQDRELKKKQSQQARDDHFPWLKVKTDYESLRKKLNTSIIEKLNDYENLVLVLEKLKEKHDYKKQGKDTQASNVKYVLKNMDMTSTKEIFLNMSRYGNPRTQQFLSRLGLSDQNPKLQTASLFNSKSEQKLLQHGVEGGSASDSAAPAGLTGGGDGTAVSSSSAMFGKVDNFWSEEKEQTFKSIRQEKKKLYNNEITSSSWNEVGFLPFVQKYIIEMKKSMQREHLLDRYAGGEWLTAEELKLLANTSELLNSCIDRKFMQSAVDIIDKDVIQNLELGLAEDILNNYEEIQIQIKKSRQEFIKQSLQKSYSKLRDYDAKKRKEFQQYTNKQFHDKKHKMLTSICVKMEKEGKFHEAPPKNLQGADSLHKFLKGKIDQEELVKDLKNINYYAEELSSEMSKKTKVDEEKKQSNQNYQKYIASISEPKQSLNSKFYQSVSRHNFHPPSKLFFIENERTAAEYTAEEIVKYSEMDSAVNELNKKDQDKFKLNLKSHIAYKNPRTFQNYYTGGPPKPSRTDPFFDPMANTETKVNFRELKYIVMIQKKIRARQQRKKIREMLENKDKDKFYEYKQKIEQIRHLTKQNFKLYPGGTDKARDIVVTTADDDPPTTATNTANASTPFRSNFVNLNAQTAFSPSNSQLQERKASYSLPKKRPMTGVSEAYSNNNYDFETAKKSEHFALNKSSEYSRPRTGSTRPYTAASSSSKVLSVSKTPAMATEEEKANYSDFRKSKEELATIPIEKQLRNVKLIEAAKSNQFWAVNTGKFIFSKRDLFYARDKKGYTALHWAVHHKNLEFIQWLLEQGADPNAPDCEGNTPIHVALKTEKFEVIMIIINGGGDLNNVNMNGDTPLAMCSEKQLKALNLQKGTIHVDPISGTENVIDNNKLLTFTTQGDIERYQAESYQMRFLSPKERQAIAEQSPQPTRKSKLGNQ